MSDTMDIGGKKAVIFADTTTLEPVAMNQFCDAMKQDFSVQGALMPDAHAGYSLPIGAVIATDGVVVPAWVGYDIGCGMCALPTTFKADIVKLCADRIFDEIYRRIPVGFSMHDKDQPSMLLPEDLTDVGREAFDDRGGFRALGTLGGGNHFIEIGADEQDVVWIIVHSGSRGIGHGIATAYMKLASPDGKAREGHFGFNADSELGKSYINDLDWALAFALENRQAIAEQVEIVLSHFSAGASKMEDELINRNHNHAELKDGRWIHRKGATHAEAGMMGVIPGNMRDGSFIVRGKGNPDSLFSSSHGAGRVMGRKQAKRELDVGYFADQMIGIKAKVGHSTLDEAPMAYKSIFEVMELQKDLVDVIARVIPIINIKG